MLATWVKSIKNYKIYNFRTSGEKGRMHNFQHRREMKFQSDQGQERKTEKADAELYYCTAH